MATERYVLGELQAPELEAFEDHYFDCRECARDVRAAAAFREVSTSLLRADPPPRPRMQPARARSLAAWFWPAPSGLLAAAAALLVAVVYQGSQSADLRQRLADAESPQAISMHFLPIARASEPPAVVARAEDRFVGVTLSASWEQSFPRYALQLVDASGLIRWSEEIGAPDPGGEIQLLLPSRDLSPGGYVLEVRGVSAKDGRRGEALARYPFTLQRTTASEGR
jgi:hypothetical protein